MLKLGLVVHILCKYAQNMVTHKIIEKYETIERTEFERKVQSCWWRVVRSTPSVQAKVR